MAYQSETVPQRFQAVAERFPDWPAVHAQGLSLTYRQLAEQASRSAGVIRGMTDAAGPVALGAAMPGQFIGVLLGILQSGRAYLFLDPQDPPARQQAILEQARPSLLIADEVVRLRFPNLNQISVEAALTGADRLDSGKVSVPPGQPCCLVLTSGSTGTPPGRFALPPHVAAPRR